MIRKSRWFSEDHIIKYKRKLPPGDTWTYKRDLKALIQRTLTYVQSHQT